MRLDPWTLMTGLASECKALAAFAGENNAAPLALQGTEVPWQFFSGQL